MGTQVTLLLRRTILLGLVGSQALKDLQLMP